MSNIPNGAAPCAAALSLTSTLAEAPISVAEPPKIAAKESGISRREADTPTVWARDSASGIMMITTGVLFIAAEHSIAAPISSNSARR